MTIMVFRRCYLACPILDSCGQVQAYLAIDTIQSTSSDHLHRGSSALYNSSQGNVFAHWKLEFLQSVCRSLERVSALVHGLGFDHEV